MASKMPTILQSIVLFSILLIACDLVSGNNEDPSSAKYDGKFDNIDLDEILTNDRLLKNYVNCLMSEGPCTPDGSLLKKTLPDAVESDCSKCTDKQKFGSEKVMHYLIDNKPDEWTRMAKIYDPKANYEMKYIKTKAGLEN